MTIATMKKKERVLAAIAGNDVDRVPFGVWFHNFLQENSASALALQTARLVERFDLDFAKPQSRPYCFAEVWGQEFIPSDSYCKLPVISKFSINSTADLSSIVKRPGNTGALGEQIESFKLLRKEIGPDVPIIATIFSPLMNLTLMHSSGLQPVLDLQRTAPSDLESALSAMSSTLADYAQRCIDAGVDGIFYASTTGNVDQSSLEEFERFQGPFDREILKKAKGGTFNVLHMCGSAIDINRYLDCEAHVLSWATTPGNPTMADVQRRTGKAVMSGAPGKPHIAHMESSSLALHVRGALQQTGGRGHLLGPDCSINPDTAPELIDVIVSTIREFGAVHS